MARVRLTREQSKALTRERLLDAARSVFSHRGFHGASVDEIAADAGYSIGAVYSNFGGKEDLFVILLEREVDERARGMAAAADESRAERAVVDARKLTIMLDHELELLLLFTEFWAYGVRDAEMRPKVAACFARMRKPLASLIAACTREDELELSAEHLAMAIDALAEGIARQQLTDPQAVPDDLLGKVLSLLLAGAIRQVEVDALHQP
ncbi:MAG: TetR/AcrR family transcriptional regulator [Solirubrobacteraceae bacterium]